MLTLRSTVRLFDASGATFEDTCIYLAGPISGFGRRLRGPVCSLAAINVIGARQGQPEPEFHRLQTVQALIALASNARTPHLPNPVIRAREFDVISRLVKHVPARRMLPPADISNIGHVCDRLVTDFESLI